MSNRTKEATTTILKGPWLTCSECGSRWPVVRGTPITDDGTPLHRDEDGSFECLACGAKIDGSGTDYLVHPTLENTLAALQLMADNGPGLGLTGDEARGLVDHIHYLTVFYDAYHRERKAYAKLVQQVDLEYDEMADLITELYGAAQAMAEYIALAWEHDPESEPGFMPDARVVVTKADTFIKHYHAHMK